MKVHPFGENYASPSLGPDRAAAASASHPRPVGIHLAHTKRSMGTMHPLLSRAALLFGLGLLAGGGGRLARERYAPPDHLPGLTVDGIELAGANGAHALDEGGVRAFVASRAAALQGRQVRLRVGAEPASLGGQPQTAGADLASETRTLGELGVSVDVEAVVLRVLALEHDGDLLERAGLVRRAKEGRIDVPLELRIDQRVARLLVDHLKEETDKAPVSARLDLEHRTVIPEQTGRYIDPWAATAAILQAARDPAVLVVTLPTADFPARHTSELLAKLDVHAVLGEYDTYFSRQGDQHRRGQNIDVAAAKIDGLVILPGEIVSFNSIVGERSEQNGFAKSWEIFKGEMVEGVGGGTCQVASTFHAAAFFGGMDVLERLPHSRPSAYIPMGLDATVVYPIVDLKIRNPFDFAVVMHAKVEGNRLRMELLGTRKVARVGFARELVESFPYKRKVTEEQKLAWSKRVVLKQHGIRGYKVKRSRTLQYGSGKYKKESNVDVYPATTEIYEVPPGFDEALLPPLPGEENKVDSDGEGSTPTPALAASAPGPSGGPAGDTARLPTMPTPATPPASSAPPSSIVQADGTTLNVQVAPGAHAPTKAQATPPKSLSINR